ncbi:hypothetical protein ACHAPX_010226 [Trichoderma viride]
MSFTDEELDRNWQPSGRRPQSTIARNFQMELEDIFGLDEQKAELQESYDTRNYNIGKNTQELASLEERLREMEQRLNAVGITAPSSDDTAEQHSPSSTPKPEASSLSAPPADDAKARSRPGTAQPIQQAPSSGDMPPTPGASEGEYYVVTREDLMDDAPR